MIDVQNLDERQRANVLRTATRLLRNKQAAEDLITFTEVTMPHPEFPDDPLKTKYDAQYFHRALAKALEEVVDGRVKRLIITFPPRHGKTELATKRMPAWFIGRTPWKHVAVGTYNATFAEDLGRAVKGIINSPAYQAIFPGAVLKRESQAADRQETTADGALYFVGRGGAITGRGADLIIIDDPLKNSEEADSPLIREALWSWFNSDIMSRFMTDQGAAIVIQCMVGGTNVLMADGTEKQLKDIRPGDVVVSYKDGGAVPARVLAWANQGTDSVFTIKTSSGRTVTANERHPFLVSRDNELCWTRLRNLLPGDKLVRLVGVATAGLLAQSTGATNPPSVKGSATPTITSGGGRVESGPPPLTQKLGAAPTFDTDTASTSASTTPCSQSKVESAPSAGSPPAKTSERIGVESSAWTTATTGGKSEACCATTATLPSDTGRLSGSYSPPLDTLASTTDEIVEIVYAGEEDVFDIQVETTENFIANGLVSHNTRWHEDDLVGRLTDPTNPCYVAEEAAQWKIINIPAIAGEEDVLGREPGTALWPGRFGIDYLMNFKRRNPRGFSALYQQRPTPDDGDFFRAEYIVEYLPDELPPIESLRVYMASDHAVATKQENDRTCIVVVGVDSNSNIWVLDCYWKRAKSDEVVEKLIDMFVKWKPLRWWAEDDHITKSIGPFLKKRMSERNAWFAHSKVNAYADKTKKAQALQGRMSMRMVLFPKKAHWWQDAREELLKFPRARHDDFVDAMSTIGRGLGVMVKAPNARAENTGPKVGTWGWVKQASKQADLERRRRVNFASM